MCVWVSVCISHPWTDRPQIALEVTLLPIRPVHAAVDVAVHEAVVAVGIAVARHALCGAIGWDPS